MNNSIPDWIKRPTLPITISVIGAGATGSLFLTHLARIQHAIFKLAGKKLMVTVVDGDKVTNSNVGRQSFYESDSGMYKAEIVTARVNRAYGTTWLAVNEPFVYENKEHLEAAGLRFASNIIVSCTDSVKSRKQLHLFIKDLASYKTKKVAPEWKPIFWLDMGNTKTTGNIIVGSPELKWKNVMEMYGKKMKDGKKEPSCSLAMSLNEQDLFINPFCATIGAKWIWECLSQDTINWRGAFVNLDSLTMQKIKV